MCDWLEAMLDFWFPEPIEVDMDGEPCASIPDRVGDHPLSEKQAPAPLDAHDALPEPAEPCLPAGRNIDAVGHGALLPEIPEMFRAEPAVLEAELVIQGRSISSAIPGRVMR